VSLTAVGTPQDTQTGTQFAVPLQAVARDAGGNPVAGVTVSFTAPASGASAVLSSNSAVTNSQGIASVTATANSAVGSYPVTAKSGTLSATFALSNSALSPCDVNQDGKTNVTDVQQMVGEALGEKPPNNDLNGDGAVNITDIQMVINAVLTLGCAAS
jgi:hypothetical protein